MREFGQIALVAALGFVSAVGCAVQEDAARPNDHAGSAGASSGGSSSGTANTGGSAAGNSSVAGGSSGDAAGGSGGEATGGAPEAGGSGGSSGSSGGVGGSGCVDAELSLSAIADADIRADSVAANDGATGDLQIRRFGLASSWRALLQFDLSGIPQDAKIVSAKLLLTVAASSGAAKSIGVHRVVAPRWDEMQVTWQSASSNGAWSKPGGDFSPTATAVTELSEGVSSGAAVRWDVTADVASYAAKPLENVGWLLKDEGEPSAGSGELVAFAARSHGNVSWQPQLKLVYCH